MFKILEITQTLHGGIGKYFRIQGKDFLLNGIKLQGSISEITKVSDYLASEMTLFQFFIGSNKFLEAKAF